MSLVEILRWVASISGMIAAVLVAARLSARATGVGFLVFTVCSLSWIGVGALDDEWKLGAQNVVLTAINLLGVYRWLLRSDS